MPSGLPSQLAVKIDVDTDRGTREGVLPLAEICQRQKVPATFLFSLGPDNTGKAIRRMFRPGFLKKVVRSNVAGNYGWRTLLNGTLLPAPHIGRRNTEVMRQVRDMGFEVGIHCHDHFRWQDHLQRMNLEETRMEFGKALQEFQRIFGHPPQTAGAPGWQCNAHSLQVYDEARLAYASDTRGRTPFLPQSAGHTFKTPQIPTTLPTLDELLGRPQFPKDSLIDHYLRLILAGGRHVHTIHAEIEGLNYAGLFENLLHQCRQNGVRFFNTADWARELANDPVGLPICPILSSSIDGRSGRLAMQGNQVASTLKTSELEFN